MPRPLAICWLLLFVSGCTGSRWARDDVDYDRKYSHHTDDPVRTVKQAVDARHVFGKHGAYAGFAGRDEPMGAGVEAGVFVYPRSWLETRLGAAVLAHDGEEPISGGGLLGVRVQSPTRLTPFVGLGGYLGWSGFQDAAIDGIDNDDDFFIDEAGEQRLDFVAAFVPEAGVHYWINSRLRVTAGADYRFASDGRDADALYYGLTLALLKRGQSSPPRTTSTAGGKWRFGEEDHSWMDAAPPSGPVPKFEPPPTAPKSPETTDELIDATLTAIDDVLEAR